MRRLLVAATLIVAAVGSAGAQPPPSGYPGYRPPPGYAPIPSPRNEYVPPPPGPRMIWESGHWHWDGYQYVWIGGRYVPGRPHYREYMPGRWVMGGAGWVWVPAHWR